MKGGRGKEQLVRPSVAVKKKEAGKSVQVDKRKQVQGGPGPTLKGAPANEAPETVNMHKGASQWPPPSSKGSGQADLGIVAIDMEISGVEARGNPSLDFGAMEVEQQGHDGPCSDVLRLEATTISKCAQ